MTRSDLVIACSQLDPRDGPVGPPHVSCSDCLDTGGGVSGTLSVPDRIG